MITATAHRAKTWLGTSIDPTGFDECDPEDRDEHSEGENTPSSNGYQNGTTTAGGVAECMQETEVSGRRPNLQVQPIQGWDFFRIMVPGVMLFDGFFDDKVPEDVRLIYDVAQEVSPGKAIRAVKATANVVAKITARTAARNLSEKLALQEAAAGAGRRVMQGRIADPRYPENLWAKMEHVHVNPDGTKIVIHYWENLVSGAREGFKFK